jgi:5'(3')-deoxyribonucleotidase
MNAEEELQLTAKQNDVLYIRLHSENGSVLSMYEGNRVIFDASHNHILTGSQKPENRSLRESEQEAVLFSRKTDLN